MARRVSSTAVLKPNEQSMMPMSLSMVLGMHTGACTTHAHAHRGLGFEKVRLSKGVDSDDDAGMVQHSGGSSRALLQTVYDTVR